MKNPVLGNVVCECALLCPSHATYVEIDRTRKLAPSRLLITLIPIYKMEEEFQIFILKILVAYCFFPFKSYPAFLVTQDQNS